MSHKKKLKGTTMLFWVMVSLACLDALSTITHFIIAGHFSGEVNPLFAAMYSNGFNPYLARITLLIFMLGFIYVGFKIVFSNALRSQQYPYIYFISISSFVVLTIFLFGIVVGNVVNNFNPITEEAANEIVPTTEAKADMYAKTVINPFLYIYGFSLVLSSLTYFFFKKDYLLIYKS